MYKLGITLKKAFVLRRGLAMLIADRKVAIKNAENIKDFDFVASLKADLEEEQMMFLQLERVIDKIKSDDRKKAEKASEDIEIYKDKLVKEILTNCYFEAKAKAQN